jgi:hypothetical protein
MRGRVIVRISRAGLACPLADRRRRDHPEEHQAERYRPHGEAGPPDHGRTEMAGAPQGGDSPTVSAAVVR